MDSPAPLAPPLQAAAERRMLAFVCSAAFLVFAQTFLVAPLIPQLSLVFRSPVEWVGLAVPAYVVPQAIGTLFAGPVSDRVGRRAVIFGSLFAFIAFTAITASVRSVDAFIGWRVATGISAAGIVPIGLTLIGDLVPYARRGRAVGWLFGSIAGGTATGAALGALLEPLVGWRSLFLGVAALCAIAVTLALAARALPPSRTVAAATTAAVLRGYRRLLAMARARRTYGYVLLNAILQSGVFTWLGVYLYRRFGLGEGGIGLVLLGYGVPGLVFGPVIGKLADRYGRARIIPAGVALTGTCALLLALPLPLNGVRAAIILLSLGFDLTHPLLAAIATDLGSVARGQAVALMAFSLFSGFGLGSLMFEAAMSLGFPGALALFGGVAWLAAVAAVFLFRREQPHAAR